MADLAIADTGDPAPSDGRRRIMDEAPDIDCISRERVEQYSRKKTIGNAQTESRGWKLTARNNKSQPINLVISDQVPVSTSGEIEVEVVLLGNGSHNKETGEIKWKIQLEAREAQEWNLQYEVKYPKRRKLILE